MQTNLLKSKIVAAGMTQSSLAKEMNISPNTLSSKINGRISFNCDEVMRICDILSIHDTDEKARIFLQ